MPLNQGKRFLPIRSLHLRLLAYLLADIMKYTLLLAACLLGLLANAQSTKPGYCTEPDLKVNVTGMDVENPLPSFASLPTKEYKVQVAILRYTAPTDFPFHASLVARYRPCEEVWVIESRESFPDRTDAVALKTKLKGLGYGEAFITELVGYL